MRGKAGEVFSIVLENPPVPGCTISMELHGGKNAITVFSLAEGTEISAEIFPYYKLVLTLSGSLEIFCGKQCRKVAGGYSTLIFPGMMAGFRTEEGVVYMEMFIQKEDIMNKALKEHEVFKLADLVPYQEGRIVNKDIFRNEKMKFAVMAFDAGTGLSEHAAPGDALVFALEGEAVISYEGKEYSVGAGENFHFAKGGLHAVKAEKPFKMGLLLTLE